jgi:hypothetical protein
MYQYLYTQSIGLKVSASLHSFLLRETFLYEIILINDNIIQILSLDCIGNRIKILGGNQYNFADADWLLGAILNSIEWVQQSGM